MPAIRSASVGRSGAACYEPPSDRLSRGDSPPNLTAARTSTALLTGSRERHYGDARSTRRPASESGHRHAARPHARDRHSCSGLVAAGPTSRSTSACAMSCSTRSPLTRQLFHRHAGRSRAGSAWTSGRCNLFQANVHSRKVPQFINFGKGTSPTRRTTTTSRRALGLCVDQSADGFLGALSVSDGIRSSAADTRAAFNRNGMNDFTGQYGANPGVTIRPDRNLGNLDDGQGRCCFGIGRLGPPRSIVAELPLDRRRHRGHQHFFDTGITVPYPTRGRSASSARSPQHRRRGRLRRYQVARELDTLNYNEINILENGFLNEFRLAQANLQANIAAGARHRLHAFGAGTERHRCRRRRVSSAAPQRQHDVLASAT